MTLGGDDGQPTTAEVLASIRRTIKNNVLEERPSSGTQQSPSAETSYETDDFELPAMFRRPREDAPILAASLVERLGAALGSVKDLSSATPSDLSPSRRSPSDPIRPAGSSSDPSGTPLIPPMLASKIPLLLDAPANQAHESVPREMPPCRDRLVVRMAGPSEPRVPAPPKAAIPKAAMGSFNYLLGLGSAVGDAAAAGDDTADTDVSCTLPPPLPHMPGTLHTAATDQLRPMLQQWLDDNINRVLTEALVQSLQRDRRT